MYPIVSHCSQLDHREKTPSRMMAKALAPKRGLNSSTPEVPPLLVVLVLLDPPIKHLPAPLVHEVPEGQEGDFVQGNAHQVVNVTFCPRWEGVSKAMLYPPLHPVWVILPKSRVSSPDPVPSMHTNPPCMSLPPCPAHPDPLRFQLPPATPPPLPYGAPLPTHLCCP